MSSTHAKYKNTLESINNLKKEIDIVEKNIKILENNIQNNIDNKFDISQCDVLKKDNENYLTQIKDIETVIDNLNNNKNIYDFWYKGFSPSGIPNLLIDESLPFMNNQIKTYLNIISHGRYSVSFDTLSSNKKGELKEKVNINVLDNINKTQMRYQFSKGQNRLVDICTILTFRDLQNNINNVSFNILILDEILDALDDKNRRMTIGALRKILNESEDLCINLVSHTQLDFIEREVDEILIF